MMDWFNIYGLVFMVIIMIPNIIFAISNKDGFAGRWHNRVVETLEQVGRFGCFAFMVINIPGTWFGWQTKAAFVAYLIGDSVLTVLYCVLWVVLWKKDNLFRALSLSIIPSVAFLFSGAMCRSVPLLVSAVVFAPMHIAISCKNVT